MKYSSYIYLSLFLYACSVNKTQHNSSPLTFKSIAKDSYGGFEEPTLEQYTNQKDFETAWRKAWSNFSDSVSLPQIDFTKNNVVLVALGMRNNGGYQLKLNSVIENNKEVIIDYTEFTPNQKCLYTQALVFPYEFISISKTSKKIEFRLSKQIGDCN